MSRRARRAQAMRERFTNKSRSWEVVRARQIAVRARKARRQAAVLGPLLAAVLVIYRYRLELIGVDMPVRIITVAALLALGWNVARDIGRALGPALLRRMDPATAGTVDFLIRLCAVTITLLVALNIAGLQPHEIVLGSAFTAVVCGLAAQQLIGNLIAGALLLNARPFRVGDRVRLQGGGVAGEVEGKVIALGLLYTALASGGDTILVPNSVVLNIAVMPRRQPDAVDVRGHLRYDARPTEVQRLIERSIHTPIRSHPHIALEELDGNEVIVRIGATPVRAADGPRLADEILAALSRLAAPPAREQAGRESNAGVSG
jgi:small conductance mechanosensitive channel